MYVKKTTRYVIGVQKDSVCPAEKKSLNQPYRVFKTGRVLTLKEARGSWTEKSADIASIANQGFDYYQVYWAAILAASGNDTARTIGNDHPIIKPIQGGSLNEESLCIIKPVLDCGFFMFMQRKYVRCPHTESRDKYTDDHP